MSSETNTVETKKKRPPRKPLPEISLDAWVLEKTNKDCVKFFKPKDSLSSLYPQLKNEGFFLLMMTKPQMDLMKRLCEKIVCIDIQKGDKFELITVIIIDDVGHSFPCASVFTDKIDQAVVEVFFLEIQSVIGSINVKVLISCKDECISDTWSRTIGCPKMKIYSSWVILDNWKKNIYLIVNKERQLLILNKLKLLLDEHNTALFIETYSSLISEMSDDLETAKFAIYMNENYSKTLRSWAPCFALEECGNVIHQFKTLHLTIKHILKDKSTRRFDRALSHILELQKSKLHDRLLILSGNKSRMTNSLKKHKLSEKTSFRVIKHESYWSVCTLSGKKEKHKIYFGNKDCKCSQKCSVCNICNHTYICSCPESNVRLNICRHIHGLCIHLATDTVEYATNDDFSASENEDSMDQPQPYEQENIYNSPVGREVDVVCENYYTDDDTLLQFNSAYADEIESTVFANIPEQNTASEIDIESRKIRLKRLFQEVLDSASDENRLQEIENSLSVLQCKLQGSVAQQTGEVWIAHNVTQEFDDHPRKIKKLKK